MKKLKKIKELIQIIKTTIEFNNLSIDFKNLKNTTASNTINQILNFEKNSTKFIKVNKTKLETLQNETTKNKIQEYLSLIQVMAISSQNLFMNINNKFETSFLFSYKLLKISENENNTKINKIKKNVLYNNAISTLTKIKEKLYTENKKEQYTLTYQEKENELISIEKIMNNKTHHNITFENKNNFYIQTLLGMDHQQKIKNAI